MDVIDKAHLCFYGLDNYLHMDNLASYITDSSLTVIHMELLGSNPDHTGNLPSWLRIYHQEYMVLSYVILISCL